MEAKFYEEPPLDRGTKIWSNGLAYMTNMAAMRIYGKNLKKIIFSGTKRPMTLEVGMQLWVLEYYKVCSTDDLEMTLTYFTARSDLVPYAFVWGKKGKTVIFFQKLL